MNRLTKLPLALAVGGAMALGATSATQADVMASAVAQLSNFEIHHTGGAILDYNTDFALNNGVPILTFTSTGGYNGTLPGTPGYNTASSAAPVDLGKVCVGNGCAAWDAAYGAENSFTHLTAPPVGNYSAADQLEAGAPITNLPGGFAPGATVSSAAYAGLTTQNALSHSQATNNLNSSFVFSLAGSGALDFNFDFSVYLQTFVSDDEKSPGFATAAFQQGFTLTDLTTGAVVWQIAAPTQISTIPVDTISLNAPLPVPGGIQLIQTNSASYVGAFTTPVLAANTLYQLSARTNANADVQRIPEPGELALLGIGLIGMTLVMARRRNQGQMGAI